MKLHIVSDGTPAGTRVEDEDGNLVENVIEIRWEIDSVGVSTGAVRLLKVPVDLTTDLEVVS